MVYETFIADDRRNSAAGLLQSLNMLIEFPQGGNFTAAQCQSWMRGAGFGQTRVEYLAGADRMVIATKSGT